MSKLLTEAGKGLIAMQTSLANRTKPRVWMEIPSHAPYRDMENQDSRKIRRLFYPAREFAMHPEPATMSITVELDRARKIPGFVKFLGSIVRSDVRRPDDRRGTANSPDGMRRCRP